MPAPADHRAAPPTDAMDRILFRSATVSIGRFQAEPHHPHFADSGPTRAHLFVFPRTTVSIQHDGGRRFVAGPPIVTFYNRGQRYRRGQVTSDGDRCDWFALAPSVARALVAELDPSVEERPDRPFVFSHGPSDPGLYLRQRRLVERCQSALPPQKLEVEETVLGLAREVIAGAQRCAAHRHRAGSAQNWTVQDPAFGRSRAAVRCRQAEIAERVKEILLADPATQVGVAGLASAVACSPHHLCRLFRRHTGWSLHQFRNQARLRVALEL